MTDDTRWDHALKVTGDGEGLAGQARAVLLRKLADQVGPVRQYRNGHLRCTRRVIR